MSHAEIAGDAKDFILLIEIESKCKEKGMSLGVSCVIFIFGSLNKGERCFDNRMF